MLTGRRDSMWEGAPDVVMLGPRGGKQLSTLAKLSSVGIEFAISTVIGMLGGRWLDEKLGTPPWLMLVGLVLGVAAGLRSLIRTARRASEEATRANQPDAPKAGEDTRNSHD